MESKVVIKDIEWNISRTGLLTPIAIFDDTDINGSIINRVELHHKDYIIDNQIGIGDTIGIEYASRKPMMSKNYTKSGNYEIPTRCPVCNSVLRTYGCKLKCIHKTCKAVKAAHISHYCEVMKISALSDLRLIKMLNTRHFKHLEDLYLLKNHKATYRRLLGEIRFNRLMDDLNKSITNCSLSQLLYALSIANPGTAATISKDCRNDIHTFMYIADKGDFTEFGLSERMSEIVGENYEKYKNTFKKLSRILFIVPEIPEDEKNDKLVGLTFVISGTPQIFIDREDMINTIELYGGRVHGSLNEKIDYYIDCGSIYIKKMAQELGIKTLSEEDFLEMVGLEYE